MAAIADATTVTLTINDIELTVPKGELIVESVKRIGLEIPIFCYHPRMIPVGMCRMCLVEVGFKQPDGSVRKMPKPQAGCTLPASDGMVVYTDTEMVHRDRKGVLEFLLINHPLDCPICDRGGECPLQNNTLFYGPSTSRFVEIKRHLPKAFPLSKYVTLDLERCIQCGRCVRFTEEISGDAELAFRFRGASMQPSTFEMRDFTSKFSGNVIEICPVGALTSARYRFRARPWDLETRPGICAECSIGCSIWFDYRVGKMVRVNGRTNEAVNEEWTCDRGKFGHDWYNDPKRLATPLVREGDALVQAEWGEAYRRIIEAFEPGGNAVAALGGRTCSNEDLFALQQLFRTRFASNNLDYRFTRFSQRAEETLERKLGVDQVRTPIAAYERKPAIFVFGTPLADELPILFLRIRKAWFLNGAKVVVAHHEATDADSFAEVVLRYRKGTELVVAAGLLRAAFRAGLMAGEAALREKVEKFTPTYVESATGVDAQALEAAASIVAAEGVPIATTYSLLEDEHGQAVIETLAQLALGVGGEFNLYGLHANDEGARRLGVLPDGLPGLRGLAEAGEGAPTAPGLGTRGILEGCVDGSVKALWLVGDDPLIAYPDRDLVERALESVEFLVVQGTNESEAVPYASVVLPMAGPAEGDGTYTNMEGRVQRFRKIIDPPGEAKPAWRTYSELMLRLRPETPYFNPNDVMEAIRSEAPEFDGASYETLPHDGVLLGHEPIPDPEPMPEPQVSG
jgi:NADH-quinone oxidoreductase subunit G